jgi:hypothetical protein
LSGLLLIFVGKLLELRLHQILVETEREREGLGFRV